MDFTSGSGGLMLVALAAVWFIVFLPSLGKKKGDKNEVARERRSRREVLVAGSSPLIAAKVRKAKLAKRTLSTLTGFAILGTVVAVFQGSTLAAGIGVAAVAAFAILVRVASNAASRSLGFGSNRRSKISNGLSAPVSSTTVEESFTEDNSWNPAEIPSQVYRGKLGTLETPELAEVVDFVRPRELASETLDEILRRRRAN